MSSILTTATWVILLKCQSRWDSPLFTTFQWLPSQRSSSSPYQSSQDLPSPCCLLFSLPPTLAFLPTPSHVPASAIPLVYKALPQIPTGLTAPLPSVHTAPPQRGLPWHSLTPFQALFFFTAFSTHCRTSYYILICQGLPHTHLHCSTYHFMP